MKERNKGREKSVSKMKEKRRVREREIEEERKLRKTEFRVSVTFMK